MNTKINNWDLFDMYSRPVRELLTQTNIPTHWVDNMPEDKQIRVIKSWLFQQLHKECTMYGIDKLTQL